MKKYVIDISKLLFQFLITLLVALIFYLIFINPSDKYLKIRDQRSAYIRNRGDSLLRPLEFEGIVAYVNTVNCGGAKAFCRKIRFVRTDTINFTDTTIDYGFIQLLKPDSNILIMRTAFTSIDKNWIGIETPVYPGDMISKRIGDHKVSVYNRKHDKIFKIELSYRIEGDWDTYKSWVNKVFLIKKPSLTLLCL